MIYGANYETWRKESETCGGCGAQSAELVLLANGWDFKACPACVAECAAVEARERKTREQIEADYASQQIRLTPETLAFLVAQRLETGCTAEETGEFKLIEPMQGSLIPEAAAPMQRVRVSPVKEVA